jgi:FkbM family methyltransferase
MNVFDGKNSLGVLSPKIHRQSLRGFLRSMRRHLDILLHKFSPCQGVLVYAGQHQGDGFEKVFRNYRRCYGFEANPRLFRELAERYGGYSGVKIFNCAVATTNGVVSFNISNNAGCSSSLGMFREDWPNYQSGQVSIVEKIEVPSINLMDFFIRNGIDRIDEYISDIQGMDLAVLKTLEPLIVRGRIGAVTCEVAKDERGNIYEGLPDNSESGFSALLDSNYRLVAKGWGILADGQFDEVPADWWEMDCKWRVRSQ